MLSFIDLTIPGHAYLFGLLQADGHMSRESKNRGRISIELKAGDAATLEALKHLLPVNSSLMTRRRDTNFKMQYCSVVWSAWDLGLRTQLNALGLPYGRKSDVVAPPSSAFSEPDYFRGLIDGDGSLGITGAGFPFVSFVTRSTAMLKAYLALIVEVTGKIKRSEANTRDQIYNVCVYKEDAQALTRYLKYPGSLCLARKAALAEQIVAWRRPSQMRRVTWERRTWGPVEDAVVLELSVPLAVDLLKRTESAVRMRRYRLKSGECHVA